MCRMVTWELPKTGKEAKNRNTENVPEIFGL